MKPMHKDDGVRNNAWACIMSALGAFDKDIVVQNKHLVASEKNILSFVSQPGRVITKMRSLPQNLLKKELSKCLLDDYFKYFSQLSDDLADANLEDIQEERPLLKYVYFLNNYINVLLRDDKMNINNDSEQKIQTNQRTNQKYLENAKRRKEENPELANKKDQMLEEVMMDNFGIDFNKWEDNLKAIEKENKMMVKFEKEKYRQEDKKVKQNVKIQEKEE